MTDHRSRAGGYADDALPVKVLPVKEYIKEFEKEHPEVVRRGQSEDQQQQLVPQPPSKANLRIKDSTSCMASCRYALCKQAELETSLDASIQDPQDREIHRRVVWRCTDLSSETEVALKVVDCNAVGNESLKGIEKEIELTGERSSPSRLRQVGLYVAKARSAMGKLCPKFYEAFRVDLPDPLVPSGRSFVKYLIMSMEFIDGVPLDKLIEFSLLNETVCAYVVYNILLALKDLHEKHIIHRDIKAANIMIGKSGRVVLCDFGVSRLLEKDAQALTFTAMSHNWGYSTTDQGCDHTIVKGHSRRHTFLDGPRGYHIYSLSQKSGGSGQVPGGLRAGYDCRADIWSLGVTAVEACLGHPPHADKFA
ncbi:Serine/threonine-protein kinase 24, partial [Perkinsus olseni]